MRTLAVIALLFSAQAFACPQLAGNFTCTYQDGSKEVMTVTQDTKGNLTTYNVNGSDIITDNVAKPMQDDANIKNATFRSWCDDDVTLKGELIGQYFNNGKFYGDLTVALNYSMSGSDLKQNVDGQVVGSNGTQPIKQETVCTKN